MAQNEKKPLQVVFAGTPDFAAEYLKILLNGDLCEVIAVYTQPDRPAGRGKKLSASPVKQLSIENNIPVYQPASLSNEMAQQELSTLKPDFLIVVAYGLILPLSILQVPAYGCINIHASLLPRWRGAAPIQRAIEAGDTETGISIMKMDEGLDTGDILYTISCPISTDETSQTLHHKLMHLGNNLNAILQKISTQEFLPKKQSTEGVSYAKKISKQEAEIDWSLPAKIIEQKIRAFNPSPVAFFQVEEKKIRVWQAAVIEKKEVNKQSAGLIIASNKEGLAISCGENYLLLTHIQLPGKRSMAFSEILNAHGALFAVGKKLTGEKLN